MKLISEREYIAHHGIKGQKWGIRRYQNPDGSLTEAGKKRYQSTLRDAKSLADMHATLEYKTRQLTAGVPKGQNILVPPEVKADYKKNLDDFLETSELLKKRYGEAITDVVAMDDGYDYIRALLRDRRLGGYVEYLSLVGPTNK